MQTKAGAPAQRPTAQEFEQVLEAVLVKARAMCGAPFKKLWVCFDHEPKQEYSDWREICSRYNAARLPHPRYGPDFNKPVEHGHAIIATGFATACYRDPSVHRNIQYRQLVRKLATEHITQRSVEKDVESMFDMYRSIAAPVAKGGTGGSWPAKHLR